jgi:POT family proton-dependent oligopeptide transporter
MLSNNKKRQHPAGLFVCAFTEFWERLGFYAVQSVLVLYLVHQFHFADKHAFATYTALTSLLYAGPVIGGIVSDRFLTPARVVILGLIFFTVGYFLLLVQQRTAFYFAFGALILGNSFVKGNITALAGSFYHEEKYKQQGLNKDSGYTIFYLIMNAGMLVGIALTTLGFSYLGYAAAFYVASGALVVSLLFFYFGMRWFCRHALTLKAKSKKAFPLVVVGSLVVLLLLALLLPEANFIDELMAVFTALAIVYFIYCGFGLKELAERKRLFVLVVLFVVSIVYWGVYMQLFTSVTLFADRNVDRVLFGFHVPASSLVFFEGIGIILFAPFLAWLWSRLGESKFQPSIGMKFALGFLFTALSFLALWLPCEWFSTAGIISVDWVIASLFFLAIGELCLSALGLSAVTALSPKSMVNTMMGFWFLTTAGGLVLTNYLADIAAVKQKGVSLLQSLGIYQHAFFDFMLLSFAVFVLMLFVVPFLKRLVG